MIRFTTSSGGVKLEDYILNLERNYPLHKIAEDIRKDIQRNLANAESYDGSEIAPLKPSTIKRKGFNAVFVETGQLLKSVAKRKIDNKTWEIFILPGRAKIMKYLQEGKSPLAGARRAFGLSKRVLDSIRSFNREYFKKAA